MKMPALVGVSVFVAAVVSVAVAQDAYPARPVTLVVPFPPGGAADIVARPVAEAMARHMQQPVIVENRAGAGGGIGIAHVARAKADGYTIMMALPSVVVLPEADVVLQRAPMFRLSQLKPIARFTADPVVLAVQASSPWANFRQFAEAVKLRPGKHTFGSSGNYGTMHVPFEQYKAATNASLLHVPYTGAGPAVAALLGGQVDAVATGPSTVAAHVRAGKLKALAHWGEGRLATMPEVPSLKELGVDVSYTQWTGLFAPAGTPDPVLARLHAAARFAATDARVIQSLQAAGTYLQFLDAPAFEKLVTAEEVAMKKLVQRIGKVE